MKSAIYRALTTGPDARSSRGIFSRGKNVYNGGASASNTGPLKKIRRPKQAAIGRRLGL